MTDLEPSGPPTIGVDLGGTSLRVAAVSAAGAVLTEEQQPTNGDFEGLVAAIAQSVRRVAASAEGRAVGIGAAGLVDRSGTVRYAPNLPMLRDAPLGAAAAEALGMPVVVDNDANVAAWGEVRHGAARGHRDALVITLGTGVGGGIVVDGRIHRGAHGFAAEVGHWQLDPRGQRCACGAIGHWEAAASGEALGRAARARCTEGRAPGVLARAGGDVTAVSARHVGASARAGEPDGTLLLAEYADQVALGFAALVNILDPEIVVVAGGLVAMGELLLEPLRRSFERHVEGAAFRPPVPIVPAALGERAGVVGAAACARELPA